MSTSDKKTYIVTVCVCISDTEVKDYKFAVTATDLQDVYRQLSGLKFEGTITKIDVHIQK